VREPFERVLLVGGVDEPIGEIAAVASPRPSAMPTFFTQAVLVRVCSLTSFAPARVTRHNGLAA
jgi:hypothetical protein